MVVKCMEYDSNKAYELYKRTKDEEYIKIISNNAHGIARKYINEGRKKCYYSIECKVPEGGNKCDDCINKKMCLLIIKTYNKIKSNYK